MMKKPLSLLVSLAFLSMLVFPVLAVSVFGSGFETGDLSEWDSSNLTPIVHPNYLYSGVYGCQFQTASNGVGFGDYVSETNFGLIGNSTFTVSWYFYNKVTIVDLDMIIAEGRIVGLVDKIFDFMVMDSGVARFSNGEGDSFDDSYIDETWTFASITFNGYDQNMTCIIDESTGEIPPPNLNGSLYRLRVGAYYVGGQPDSLQKEVWFDSISVSDDVVVPGPTYVHALIGLTGVGLMFVGVLLPAFMVAKRGFFGDRVLIYFGYGALSLIFGFCLIRVWLFGGFG